MTKQSRCDNCVHATSGEKQRNCGRQFRRASTGELATWLDVPHHIGRRVLYMLAQEQGLLDDEDDE
jgi:hypothetical protein